MLTIFHSKHVFYKSNQEVRTAIIQASLYACFLIVTTIIALSCQHVYMYYFNQSIERLFLTGIISENNDDMSYENLVTIEEFWSFLKYNFFEDLDNNLIVSKTNGETFAEEYDDEEDTTHKDQTEETLRSILTDDNILLGVPRLRQIRVKPHSCVVHEVFKRFFNNCFASYSYGAEDTNEFYEDTQYFSRELYKATPISGSIQTYNGPGYMQFLSFDKQTNVQIAELLESMEWIDRSTRVALLEFVIYNAETQLFNNMKFIIEILPTGGILPRWDLRLIPLYTIWSPVKPGLLVAAIIFYLFIVYYTSVEIGEMRLMGFKNYFRSTNNYIDIVILLTAYTALTLSMQHPFDVDSYLKRITKNPYSLASLDEPCFWYSAYVCSMAFCVFVVWAKVFRYIGFNRTMLQFTATLVKCGKDILGFGIMFVIVFVGFALFGMLIFGTSYADFSTFQNALFTMVRMVLGDFQYERIEKANRILGPIFSVCYVIFITFILLNMFLAIINETYSIVKQEITDDENALKSFIINTYKKMVNLWKRCRSKREHAQNFEFSPKSSIFGEQHDGSMLEYADVPVSKQNKPAVPLSKPFNESISKPEVAPEDDLNEDLTRLTERVELLENLIKELTINVNRIFGRPSATQLTTPISRK